MRGLEISVFSTRGLALLLLIGCSQDVSTGRRCEPGERACTPAGRSDGGTAGASGTSGGTSGGGAVGDSDNALTLHVEDIEGMTIEIVTLACAGDCADIEAVASGGHAPYTFAWDDGSTEPTRHVCLDASSQLTVSATDTAIVADELGYEAQTVHTELTATVLDCREDAGADAGPDPACLENPSFEGSVTPTQLEAFSAAPWNACYEGGLSYSAIADASLWPTQNWTFPDASDGATYLALGQQLVFAGRASQTLCEPLQAGATRSFLVDLAHASTTDGGESQDQAVEVLGGTAECAEELVLWTSPALTLDWATHCVTLSPEQTVTTLGFRALGRDGGLVEALVDNIRPVSSCP